MTSTSPFLRAAARVVSSGMTLDRKSTRLNSSHLVISYAVFCLKKKNTRGISVRRVGGFVVFCVDYDYAHCHPPPVTLNACGPLIIAHTGAFIFTHFQQLATNSS